MHIAADVWLGKGNPAPTLLASYFTLKLLTEHFAKFLKNFTSTSKKFFFKIL